MQTYKSPIAVRLTMIEANAVTADFIQLGLIPRRRFSRDMSRTTANITRRRENGLTDGHRNARRGLREIVAKRLIQ
jgi:hypothetical protein